MAVFPQGDHLGALRRAGELGVLPKYDPGHDALTYITQAVPAWIDSNESAASDRLAVTATAAAALCAFATHHLLSSLPPGTSVLSSLGSDHSPGKPESPFDRGVLHALEADGEELIGKIEASDFLLLALHCLPHSRGLQVESGRGSPGSWPATASWWAARCVVHRADSPAACWRWGTWRST